MYLPVEYSSCSVNWSSLVNSVITWVVALIFVILAFLSLLTIYLLIELLVIAFDSEHGGDAIDDVVVLFFKTATDRFTPFIFYMHARTPHFQIGKQLLLVQWILSLWICKTYHYRFKLLLLFFQFWCFLAWNFLINMNSFLMEFFWSIITITTRNSLFCIH